MSEPPDPPSPHLGAVVLAAGQGTRMRSQVPKVLHPLVGQPMVAHVLDALEALGVAETVLVVGHGAQQVRDALGDRARYADQPEQRGTGHAVQQAIPHLDPAVERVLVLYGDTPLITAETLRALIAAANTAFAPGPHTRDDAPRRAAATAPSTPPAPSGTGDGGVGQSALPGIGGRRGASAGARGGASPSTEAAGGQALLTMEVPDPTGYGRVVRDGTGRVVALIEDRDATAGQRATREVNVGAYVFDAVWLRARVPALRPAPGGEYYLTDLIRVAAAEGRPLVAVPLADPLEGLGVNDRMQLAQAEAALQDRLRERLMCSGVTLLDPATTYVDATVTVGPDTVLRPQTFLHGRTRIGAGCDVGPGAEIYDSLIGDRCRVWRSVLEGATLADDVQVGPFAHLRPGARLASGVAIGNFAEVKNAVLHEGVAQHHFSYLGDAEVGRDTNVGAGTITCNFDGVDKHRTEIGERVFLGSDTLLVAPVRLGDDSATGAGAVVTRDVPAGKLAVGIPAHVARDRAPGPPSNGTGTHASEAPPTAATSVAPTADGQTPTPRPTSPPSFGGPGRRESEGP